VASAAGASVSDERTSASANPTSAVSGVRKSCDSADSSELRKRSDSICTSALRATSA
jgi:hypothetical protein